MNEATTTTHDPDGEVHTIQIRGESYDVSRLTHAEVAGLDEWIRRNVPSPHVFNEAGIQKLMVAVPSLRRVDRAHAAVGTD